MTTQEGVVRQNTGTASIDPDRYGVAVRAGAVTPQIEDETLLREQMGLPEMSDAARALWAKQSHVRQPLTIKAPETDSALKNPEPEEDEEA